MIHSPLTSSYLNMLQLSFVLQASPHSIKLNKIVKILLVSTEPKGVNLCVSVRPSHLVVIF